jgi:hypothetical protein
MSAWIAQHRKLIAAVAGAVVTVVVQVWGTNTPWVTALILIAMAAGVYRAPNEPQAAPAAPALPRPPGGGGTGAIRVIPAQEPAQAYQQVSGHPLPPAGTEGGPATGVRG